MKPSIGRIVHLTSGRDCQAAIITEVGENKDVRLTIFRPGGPMASRNWWPHSEQEFHDGTWHWPERVE